MPRSPGQAGSADHCEAHGVAGRQLLTLTRRQMLTEFEQIARQAVLGRLTHTQLLDPR